MSQSLQIQQLVLSLQASIHHYIYSKLNYPSFHELDVVVNIFHPFGSLFYIKSYLNNFVPVVIPPSLVINILQASAGVTFIIFHTQNNIFNLLYY
jgi:hypothetical protein